ncbi:hypothetical protein [Actinoplanes sp. HUAS TT8]|uniref:hypothetical protein n=1 Tax=Actinoplanes sp. HUAS TT8 TaxID=3447453 RepID=UPI003F5249F9
MTINIEDLIRTAQERQAERAAPADRIRAALPQRAAVARRRRRYGALAATVAAAAVTAAVTVPALALRGTGPTLTPPTAAAPTISAGPPLTVTQTASLPAEISLEYRPTWVPAGYGERVRQADTGEPGMSPGPRLMRVWKKQLDAGEPWIGASITLYVRPRVADLARGVMDTSGQKVDINGVDGWFSPSRGDGTSSLNWEAADHTVLMISTSQVEIDKADLLRMARSVRPDPAIFTVPVRLRWLPDGMVTAGATVSGPSAGVWRASINAARREVSSPTVGQDEQGEPVQGTGVADTASIFVVVGTTTDAPSGGEKLTIGGRPARHPVNTNPGAKDFVYLVVDLGHGRLMTLTGLGAAFDDLVKVAEQAQITPVGLDWLDH